MTLHAGIDHVNHKLVCGWVYDDIEPDNPISMLVSVDDVVVARVLANIYRKDLEDAGFGNGRHGFNVALSVGSLARLKLRLLRESDESDFPGSPIVLETGASFGEEMRAQLAAMLIDTGDAAELGRRAVFLAQQADRLLQRRADIRSNRPDPVAQRQFRVRWSGKGPPPPPEPGPRVLVINDTMVDAGRDAGSQALISHMTSLVRLGCRVTFAPADMAGGDGMDALAALGIDCACAPWSGSVEEVLRREAGGFASVYVHRGTNARYLPLIRYCQPKARVVYSVADLHYLRIARQAEVEARPELKEASARIRAGELSAARFSDSVITHSEHEAALLRRDLPNARIHVVPWHIPARPTAVPFEQRGGMAFIGSYGHPPNLDAAWWLVQDVMPIVRSLNPAITCQLVGSGMPDGLRANTAPGVIATGHVPSLPALFDTVRLTVAPLTFGAGVKGKVLESMAAGVPCACTPIAAEGMTLPAPLPDLVAADAEGLARLIVRLHDNAALNAQAAAAGLAYVADTLSEARVDALLRAAMQMAPA